MVGTRRQPAKDTDTPLQDGAELLKELRKLYIDGKDTMKGEARKEEDVAYYSWRGATYAITDGTPQAWIDAEAHKRRKSKKRLLEEETTNQDSKDDQLSKKRKQAHDNIEEVREDGRPQRKRKSTVASREMLEDVLASNKRLSNGSTSSNLDRPASRDKRPCFPNMRNSLSGQKDTSRTRLSRSRTKSLPRVDTSVPNFNQDPEQSETLQDLIEDQRDEARDDGMEVDPLPAATTSTTPADDAEMADVPTVEQERIPAEEEPADTAEREDGTRRESGGYETLLDLVKLAKVNTRIARLQDQYGKMRVSNALETIRKQRALRLQSMGQTSVESESPFVQLREREREQVEKEQVEKEQAEEEQAEKEDQEQEQAAGLEELREQLTAAVEDAPDFMQPAVLYNDARDIPTETPDLETDRSTIDHHDSAATSTSSDTTAAADASKPAVLSPPKPIQQIRWSLGSKEYLPLNILPDLQLSEHLEDDDRAEATIYLGRLAGESKSARRRRVKREKAHCATIGVPVQ